MISEGSCDTEDRNNDFWSNKCSLGEIDYFQKH